MSLSAVVVLTLTAFVAMSIEAGLGHRRGLRIYRWDATLSHLSCSAGNLVSIGAFGITGYVGYEAILAGVPWRFADPGNPVHWAVGLVVVDFMLWVRHWSCHRVGFLWAVHAVHHQAQDLNLGSAQRSPWLQGAQALPTSWALALLGVPLEMAATGFALTVGWQLFMHTELVGKLGWLDRILVTPSVHRVHHGCNARYLDKNYGGILAVWDVLLGTWEEEDEAPVYGTLTGLDSYDPLWANAKPWVELCTRAATAPTWWGAAETFLRPPSWDPVTRTERLYEGPRSVPTGAPAAGGRLLVFAAALALVLTIFALPAVHPVLLLALGLGTWGVLSAVDLANRPIAPDSSERAGASLS